MEGKRTCFTWRGKWEEFGDALAEKKVSLSGLMSSNIVKPKRFEHLHQLLPLNIMRIYVFQIGIEKMIAQRNSSR